MGFSSFNQKRSHGTMDDQEDIISSSASSEVSSCLSSSEEQDSMGDEVTSSPSTCSPTSPLSSSESACHHLANGPLNDMSSLLQQLPFKKGLSKHYEGKSQSFTSLANVRCLEDLAKPENRYNKKLKSCRSYGGGQSESHHNRSNHRIPRSNTSSRLISKKASRGSCSSLGAKRTSSLLGSRPPLPAPHRSTSASNFSSQTPLFA